MTEITTPGTSVRIERTISAPPHRVYEAWLDPDIVRTWMVPGSFEAWRVDIDRRIGGHYRVFHAQAGQDSGGFEAEILEMVPDQRLVWRWGFVGPERTDGPVYDSQLTVTLRPGPAGTTVLTLVHENLDALSAGLPHVAASVQAGWEDVIIKLGSLVQAA
jgi:uncharacterized protein YndB with AHSA1/START domain